MSPELKKKKHELLIVFYEENPSLISCALFTRGNFVISLKKITPSLHNLLRYAGTVLN